jgi:hypothetical protein
MSRLLATIVIAIVFSGDSFVSLAHAEEQLPSNRWVKLHEQKPDDAVAGIRRHGGRRFLFVSGNSRLV